MPPMDECVNTALVNTSAPAEVSGDVDDLIFCMEPDWLTSDR